MAGAIAIRPEAEDHPAERELRQKKNHAGDHKRTHKLLIVGDSVLIDRQRKPPRLGSEEIANDYRQYPNDGSEQHPSPPLGIPLYLSRNHKYHNARGRRNSGSTQAQYLHGTVILFFKT